MTDAETTIAEDDRKDMGRLAEHRIAAVQRRRGGEAYASR